MGTILLFYKYVHIQHPLEIQKWQKNICQQLGLTGRILLAHEGINGTLGGDDQAIQEYMVLMNEHPLFGDIDFKTAPGGSQAFPRMKISVKNEIVHLGLNPAIVTTKDAGQHLTPQQTHQLLSHAPKDLVILDARNNYESAVGTFVGAITPDIRYFRQLPQYIDENIDQFKDKTVLMFCTGGIRCERATAYLNQKQVASKVYQVEGGIHRYVEQFPDGFFRGKNYVFDNRITVAVNNDILSKCLNCSLPSDEYFNCINALCNKHFTSCAACITNLHKTCSQKCHELIITSKTPERSPFQKIKG